MQLYDFTKAVKELCDYYERKEPRQGTMELWFERVKSIPSEAINWILKQIFNDYETFPRNLPGTMAVLFFSWKEAHPEKIYHERRHCPDCTDGTIKAWKLMDNRHISYLFRCGLCRQSQIVAWPIATMSELLVRGYDLNQQQEKAYKAIAVSPKHLAQQVAMNMEFPA